ncbi:hypothetical protein B9Z65_8233 [Elsinoe australis]|uniref:C2H2-type domain-containing protein n=1 Tax=Elsinoe australis TaxID=40998 RepID=A0A2P7ZMI4_9PEZI|nr:hypothetical protein B9Z65_8233 [Elsinoe australis]
MAAAINLPPMADHAPSIAELTLRCQGALDDCRQIEELQHDEWVDLRFTDFNSWVESSGALANGRASLDSRLDVPGTEDMKDMVTDSLEILEIALLGCIKTACDSTLETGNAHNDTPDVSGSDSVLVEAKDDVLQLITQLLSLTCSIREVDTKTKLNSADEIFDADRHNWTKHMREEHSSSKFWLCTMCNVETRFSDEKSFAQHLSSQHEATAPMEHLDMFVQAASRSAPLELDQCPVCPPGKTIAINTSALVDHVARHLQDFALYSLPWSTPAEDEADLVRMGKRSVSGVNEPLSYFDQNEYFDVESHASTSTQLSEARSSQSHELPALPDTDGIWDVITVHKQALDLNRDLFGENHVQTVSSRCVLAEAYVIEGQCTEAMRLLFGMLFPVGSLSDAAAIRSKVRDMRAHQRGGRLDIAAKLRIHLLANCVLTTTGQAVGVYMEDRFVVICLNLNDKAHPGRNVLSRSIEEARTFNLQDHIDTLKLAVKLCIALDWIHPQEGQEETLRKAIEQSRVLAEDIAALGRSEQLGVPLPPPPHLPTVVSTHNTDSESRLSQQSRLNLLSMPAIPESPSVIRTSQSEHSRIHSGPFLEPPTVPPETEQPMLTSAPFTEFNAAVKGSLDREPLSVPGPSLSNTSTGYRGQISTQTDHRSERGLVSPNSPVFDFSDLYFYPDYRDPTYEEDGKVDSFDFIDSTYLETGIMMWDHQNRNEFTNNQHFQPWIPTGSALSAGPFLYSSSLLPQSYETSASFPTSSLDHPSESIDYQPGIFESVDNRPGSEGDEQAKTPRNPRDRRRPYHIGTPTFSDDDDNSSKRTHRCYVPDCINMNGFASSSGLLRHQREVHGMHGGVKEKLFCRYLDCKRHTGREFARRANRDQHEKRIHGDPFLPEVAKAAAAKRKTDTASSLEKAKSTADEVGSGQGPTIASP